MRAELAATKTPLQSKAHAVSSPPQWTSFLKLFLYIFIAFLLSLFLEVFAQWHAKPHHKTMLIGPSNSAFSQINLKSLQMLSETHTAHPTCICNTGGKICSNHLSLPGIFQHALHTMHSCEDSYITSMQIHIHFGPPFIMS